MLEITNPGSGYRMIPVELYWDGTNMWFNLGTRDIGNDPTAMNALVPNGVTVYCPALTTDGTTITAKTWAYASYALTNKWKFTLSSAPFGGVGYYQAVLGMPRISASIGSGGGFDYRVIQANRRRYRIPPGNYYWSAGFGIHGATNAEVDCTGVVFWADGANAAGFEIGDTASKVDVIGLTYQNRYTGGTLDPMTRGDSMPYSLRGAFNRMKDCVLESGGDFGMRIGGYQFRSYGLNLTGYRSYSSWGDFVHVGNVDGLTLTDFLVQQAGDDGIALYSDVLGPDIYGITQPTLTGYVTYININNPGSGYNNGTFLCNANTGSAVASVTVSGGLITSVSVNNGGGGYTSGVSYNLTPLGGGTGGSLTGQLSWNGVTGSWGGANQNIFQRFGYQATMTMTDTLKRLQIAFTISNTNNGTLTTTATFVNGGYGYTGQPTLQISAAGKNINVSNGIFNRGGWRGILIGPYGWSNVSISNIVFNGTGSFGIMIGDGSDSYVGSYPNQTGINISGLTYSGIGTPQYRDDVTRNLMNIFSLSGGSITGIVVQSSDNQVVSVQYSSNVQVQVNATQGTITYSGAGNSNVGYLSASAF